MIFTLKYFTPIIMFFYFAHNVAHGFLDVVARAGPNLDYSMNPACALVGPEPDILAGSVVQFLCNPPVLARYISLDINQAGPSMLQIAEVVVKEYNSMDCVTNDSKVLFCWLETLLPHGSTPFLFAAKTTCHDLIWQFFLFENLPFKHKVNRVCFLKMPLVLALYLYYKSIYPSSGTVMTDWKKEEKKSASIITIAQSCKESLPKFLPFVVVFTKSWRTNLMMVIIWLFPKPMILFNLLHSTYFLIQSIEALFAYDWTATQSSDFANKPARVATNGRISTYSSTCKPKTTTKHQLTPGHVNHKLLQNIQLTPAHVSHKLPQNINLLQDM